MLEFFDGLNWPGALAITGTVVTIVIGLFGYMRSTKSQIPDYEKLHSRINNAITRISESEGDIKELRASLRAALKQIADHEQRDIEDFKMIEAKLDRLMDIVVRVLQDEHL